jgi:hypothetical protein
VSVKQQAVARLTRENTERRVELDFMIRFVSAQSLDKDEVGRLAG